MNYEQFAIWLHGFLEISDTETINEQQTQIIKDHLALLFEKKTPDRSKKKQDDPFENFKKLAEEWEKDNQKIRNIQNTLLMLLCLHIQDLIHIKSLVVMTQEHHFQS